MSPIFYFLIFLALSFPLFVLFFGLGWLWRGLRCGTEIDALRYRAQRAEDELAAAGGSGAGSDSSSGSVPASAKLKEVTAERESLKEQLAAAASGDEGGAASQISALTAERDSYRGQLDFLKSNLEESAAYASGEKEKDDLQKIKGVGKVLNSKLNSYGLYAYEQIVNWDEPKRAAFAGLIGFGDRITRDDWQGQAGELHKEKYGKKA